MTWTRLTDDVAKAGTEALVAYLDPFLPESHQERCVIYWAVFGHMKATISAFAVECNGLCRVEMPDPSLN